MNSSTSFSERDKTMKNCPMRPGFTVAPVLKRCFAAVVGLSACIGCGGEQALPDRATVAGSVTFDGKPLPAGTIGFKSADGSISTAVKIRDGAYSTNRAPIGKVLVTVDTTSVQVGNRAKYVPIPDKYRDATTSELSAEVQAGENEDIDFSLEK